MDETKDLNDSVEIGHCYEEFKVWYQDVFNNNKIPSKLEFKKYFKKKYVKRLMLDHIKGFKFKLKDEKKIQENIENKINNMSGY